MEIRIRDGYPALNVKCYNFPSFSESETINEWLWEDAQREFWEDAKALAKELLDCEIYSDGRSGGWLVADIRDTEDWDASQLAKWQDFAGQIRGMIDYHKTPEAREAAIEHIMVNRWNEPGAEYYNFVECRATDGAIKDVCTVDLKRVENEARQAYIDSL